MSTEMTSNLEDYLEMVYFLSPQGQGVHAAVVAERLGVTRASVTGALRALAKRGYITYHPYAPVLLTPEGVALARACAERHHFLHGFLRDDLGMDDGAAEAAACKMEHAVSADIVRRLAAYVERNRLGARRPGLSVHSGVFRSDSGSSVAPNPAPASTSPLPRSGS